MFNIDHIVLQGRELFNKNITYGKKIFLIRGKIKTLQRISAICWNMYIFIHITIIIWLL